MTTPPELESLGDSELDEIFAVEVTGGWHEIPMTPKLKSIGVAALFRADPIKMPGSQEYTPEIIRWKDGSYGGDALMKFSTDANAVLPWLEKHSPPPRAYYFLRHQWFWRVDVEPNTNRFGEAPTFARAAVIALIKAKRAEKT